MSSSKSAEEFDVKVLDKIFRSASSDDGYFENNVLIIFFSHCDNRFQDKLRSSGNKKSRNKIYKEIETSYEKLTQLIDRFIADRTVTDDASRLLDEFNSSVIDLGIVGVRISKGKDASVAMICRHYKKQPHSCYTWGGGNGIYLVTFWGGK